MWNEINQEIEAERSRENAAFDAQINQYAANQNENKQGWEVSFGILLEQ
jgi:hypothetical protein